MRNILVIADRPGQPQRALHGALQLAARQKTAAKVMVVAAVHENLTGMATHLDKSGVRRLRDDLLAERRRLLEHDLEDARATGAVEMLVIWEKHLVEWVVEHLRSHPVDLVVKTAHRSQTLLYTPMDWQLIRRCPAPLMLVTDRWRRGRCVMAFVDLGTRIAAKRELNWRVLAQAHAMATRLKMDLHVAYAPPLSPIVRDLIDADAEAMAAAGERLARGFVTEASNRKMAIAQAHVKVGPPDKVLVSLASRHRAALVVMGTVARKALAGKVIGNTAERVLSLLGTDLVVIKPG